MTLPAFKSVLGRGRDWAHVAKSCTDALGPLNSKAQLGFLYVTEELAEDLKSLLAYLQLKTGLRNWVGTIGLGIYAKGQKVFDEPAAAAMVCDVPENCYHLFTSLSHKADGLSLKTQKWLAKNQPPLGIVHGDPSNVEIPAIISNLAKNTGAFLAGGLASSYDSSLYSLAGIVTGGGISGVLFTSDVEVMTGLSQSCVPFSDAHVISDCLDNIIIGINGRPALDILKEEIGESLARDLRQISGQVHIALPIKGSDTRDYTVHSLLAIDINHGWLAINGHIEPGECMMFARRNPVSARDNLKNMLKRLHDRLPHCPRGAIYISCTSRDPSMLSNKNTETKLINRFLGDFPIIGFFSNGEISSSRLHEYTKILMLFL